MWWINAVLIFMLLHVVLCQDTSPEWLEPNNTSTTTTTSVPPTTTTVMTTTEKIPTTTTERIPITTTTERMSTTTTYPTTTYPTTTYPTTRYPTTSYPTTRYPTTRYPTTRHPTTKYPTRNPTRYPPTRYPTTTYSPTLMPTSSTAKPSQEACKISLSKPVVRYYTVFGLLYKSITQCCNLCCTTKYKNQVYCKRIAMQYCQFNSDRSSYYNEYEYDY